MHAILYSRADRGIVTDVHRLLSHLVECPACRRRAAEEKADVALAMFDLIDRISPGAAPVGDYEGALAVCEVWLAADMIYSLMDLTGGDGDAQVQ
jgi:hypothetical protein